MVNSENFGIATCIVMQMVIYKATNLNLIKRTMI